MKRSSASTQGFTLIELSIVLVIIGLIVGGILVGEDLIRAAGVRATISQIEKYNTAVNTFYGKYGAFPGDMNAATAAQFGFTSRDGTPGWGDGNGVLQGLGASGGASGTGELCLFWMDLSQAGQIEGTFTGTSAAGNAGPCQGPYASVRGAELNSYFPQAKLGAGNYIYVWSGGYGAFTAPTANNGINYFGMSAVTALDGDGNAFSNPALTAQQAYSMDVKLDDGLPLTGNVTIAYNGGGWIFWASDNDGTGLPPCANWTQNTYAMGTPGLNCALSFKFQ